MNTLPQARQIIRIPKRSIRWRQIGGCVVFRYPESMIAQIGAEKRFGVSFRGITSYGQTPRQAIAHWHQARQGRDGSEQKRFSRDLAVNEYGFDEACIGEFCRANDLLIEGSYTRQELRASVIQRRAMNNDLYRAGLTKIGIYLGGTRQSHRQKIAGPG